MTKLCQIWVEECEVAVAIEAEFGTEKALDYFVGEKFLDFLVAADDDPAFRSEVSAFVAAIKGIFRRRQLAEYLARRSNRFVPNVYDEEATAEFENPFDIRRGLADLLLVERAKEWLLGDEESVDSTSQW